MNCRSVSLHKEKIVAKPATLSFWLETNLNSLPHVFTVIDSVKFNQLVNALAGEAKLPGTLGGGVACFEAFDEECFHGFHNS